MPRPFTNIKSLSFDISERLVGGAAYDKEGNSISDETMQAAMDCDAVLFGAVGGAKWDNVERDKRPEAALLRLRKDLDLFANLRPAVVLDALSDSSSLKSDLVKGLDILIIRELTSGVYLDNQEVYQKLVRLKVRQLILNCIPHQKLIEFHEWHLI